MKNKLSFNERLNQLIVQKSSFLCIGLDPDMDRLPAHLRYEKNPLDLFVREIVSATHEHVVAYKANLAFFESEGLNGLDALQNLAGILPRDVILILDGKRGDIENTSRKYVTAYFDQLHAHALTVNPYMGYDAVRPFLARPDRGAFILALTSNPGAEDFQYLQIGPEPLYLYVGRKVRSWNKLNNCGLVIGATEIDELQMMRRALPELPFLIPGVGAQGGDFKEVLKRGRDQNGTGMLINIGRDIIYADSGREFARVAKDRAAEYVSEMTRLMRTSWDFI